MKKIIANAHLCVLLCTATAYKEQFGCMHPVQLKKTTEDILNKVYTEKGTITGIWLVLFTVEVRIEFTGFQSGNKLADARTAQKGGGSLIKNLTPLEDDAEIRLLNFPMHANSQKIH